MDAYRKQCQINKVKMKQNHPGWYRFFWGKYAWVVALLMLVIFGWIIHLNGDSVVLFIGVTLLIMAAIEWVIHPHRHL